jgi:hypothetical protein
MMKIKYRIALCCACYLPGMLLVLFAMAAQPGGQPETTAVDPLNATYPIEGHDFHFFEGRHEMPSAHGSATKTRSAVTGRPVYGDLDGDGAEDAVLLITHDPGGSGTFTYLAVAIFLKDGFQGVETFYVGDRIKPMEIAIRRGLIVVRYTDRRPQEPMSALPTVDQTRCLRLINGRLVELTPVGQKGNIVEGWLTIGHEVRTFKPCEGEEVFWLVGKSPAITEIMDAYNASMSPSKPYEPMLVLLAVQQVDPPLDGFGADYERALLAMHLIIVAPGYRCEQNKFMFE